MVKSSLLQEIILSWHLIVVEYLKIISKAFNDEV